MKGMCRCGEVQYELTDVPLFVHACHCTNCQRQSGSVYALNAMIEASCFSVLSGETDCRTVPTDSGKGQVVHQCTTCRTSLWSNYLSIGTDFVYIHVGTLEQPELCPPDINIYIKSKMPWSELDPKLPAADIFYDRKKLWSKAALDRFNKVIGR